MGSHSVLPNLSPIQASELEELQFGPPTPVLYGELGNRHPPVLMVLTKVVGNRKEEIDSEDIDHQQRFLNLKPLLRLCLFKLSMPADGPLEAVLRFSKPRLARSVKVGLFAAYRASGQQDVTYRYSEIPHNISLDSHRMSLGFQGGENRLVEFGVYCEKSVDIFQPLQLLHIYRLVISPSRRSIRYDFAIHNIRLIRRGEDLYGERRLAWQWRGVDDTWPNWLPWSKTTGPFSHFTIWMDGRDVGKGYCLEFSVHAQDIEASESIGESVEVRISGTIFGGGEIMSMPVIISKSDLISQQ